jgi:hypothetical protein
LKEEPMDTQDGEKVVMKGRFKSTVVSASMQSVLVLVSTAKVVEDH